MVHRPGEQLQAHNFCTPIPWKTFEGSFGFHPIFYFPDVVDRVQGVDFGKIRIQSTMGKIPNESMPSSEYLNAVHASEITHQRTRLHRNLYATGGAISLGSTVFLRLEELPSPTNIANVTVETEIFGQVEFSVHIMK